MYKDEECFKVVFIVIFKNDCAKLGTEKDGTLRCPSSFDKKYMHI